MRGKRVGAGANLLYWVLENSWRHILTLDLHRVVELALYDLNACKYRSDRPHGVEMQVRMDPVP